MTGERSTTDEAMTWVDAEVHLLPPDCCAPTYRPPDCETVLRRKVYDHPERDQALSQATAEGLLSEMEAAGIDRAVITGLPWHDAENCDANNVYIAEVVERYPDRFLGLGVLGSLSGPDPAGAVRRVAQEHGLRGLKVIPSWHGFQLDDEAFAPVIEQVIKQNLVLMPHTDHLYIRGEADTAAALFEVARRYPELRILAPHLGGLLCLYALYPPVRSVITNMLFITSVPLTMHMVCFATEAVGAGRLAFGTDFPFNPSHDQRTVRQALEALPLAVDQKRAIAGENVLRFLGGTA